MATIFIAMQEYEKAHKYLKTLFEDFGNFKSQTYLLYAITLHKMKQSKNSLKILDKLTKKEASKDCLFYRAKLNLQFLNLQKSLEDSEYLLEIHKTDRLEVHILHAETLLLLNRIEECKQKVSTILSSLGYLPPKSHPKSARQRVGKSKARSPMLRKCLNILAQVHLK